MAIAIGVVAIVGVVVFVVWNFVQDTPETTMGRENRLRREARKASKSEVPEEDLGDRG